MAYCGGGGGAYAKKTYASGDLKVGSVVTVCVGAGGQRINNTVGVGQQGNVIIKVQ
jgi:hypothetical protein